MKRSVKYQSVHFSKSLWIDANVCACFHTHATIKIAKIIFDMHNQYASNANINFVYNFCKNKKPKFILVSFRFFAQWHINLHGLFYAKAILEE